jgi:photosystem II stability/assembly factor-like uncharacterized protein
MKKMILVLFVLILFVITANAQWVQQYTGTTANLYDIEFLNRYTGWCVGTGGTCLKTTNGGINWIQMNHPVGTKPIESVHIVDSNVVYFVGNYETIFKTTNGGSNWIVIKNGPGGQGNSYFGLYFLNENTGWISGISKILKTTNGGLAFDSAYIEGWTYDMYFKDANTGIVTSEGRVFKTTNGGVAWYVSLETYTTRIFWKVSVVGNQFGWVASFNENAQGVYRTTNLGNYWSLICDSSIIDNMEGVCFVNKDTGFIGGMYNKLFKTRNGGTIWMRENTQTNNDLFFSIEFINDTIGWISSSSGIILHTTTGGQTLTSIPAQTENFAEDYELYQNYPNPFNNQTKIEFTIPKFSEVRIVLYDIVGRQRDIITDGIYQSGKYETIYTPKNISSGVYFYKMEVNGKVLKTKKLIMQK